MTRPFRFGIPLLFALGVAAPWAGAQTPPKPVGLTILHTNDTHGHLLPFSYPDATGRQLDGRPVYRNIGGIARRATLAKQIRREQQARNVPVWLVDVGDYSDGTPFSTEYRGEADVAAMNAAGYDLGTLGNHEFNHPAAQVKKLIEATKYQLVSANITERATGHPLVPPFVIRQVDGVRIAVFGLTTREAAGYPAGKEAFDVADEIETARKMVEILKPQSDIIILLSHAGDGMDQRLADQVPDIDVIVGGHSHSRLPSGRNFWDHKGPRPADPAKTVIAQAYQWGGELGRLDLWFTRDAKGEWRVDKERSSARLVAVTDKYASDPAVAAVVAKYWEPIFSRYGEVIGRATGEFSARGNDAAEYNLMADAQRETFGTDFAMENRGGIRAPLLQGSITLADLVTLDPFDNTVVLFKVTGRQIREILERTRPHVSGLRYRIQERKLVDVKVGGNPLDDERTYTGVTNSYFARTALKGIDVTDTGKARLETLIAYIRKKGKIAPAYDGRRIVADEAERR